MDKKFNVMAIRIATFALLAVVGVAAVSKVSKMDFGIGLSETVQTAKDKGSSGKLETEGDTAGVETFETDGDSELLIIDANGDIVDKNVLSENTSTGSGNGASVESNSGGSVETVVGAETVVDTPIATENSEPVTPITWTDMGEDSQSSTGTAVSQETEIAGGTGNVGTAVTSQINNAGASGAGAAGNADGTNATGSATQPPSSTYDASQGTSTYELPRVRL